MATNKFFARIISFMLSALLFFGSAFSPAHDWLLSKVSNTAFSVDASQGGKLMNNKVNNFNSWSSDTVPPESSYVNADPMEFVEYIQLMQATGGSAERDLFIDPHDRTVLDDYDFSKLITACHNVLSLGAKPHIKTGNVPLKLTSGSDLGYFGVNLYPPDDYNQYFTYIAAIATALVDEFGLEEVKSWPFGVLTEFENADWFMAKSGDPHDSFVAYCKLYDYTVAALESVIGTDVIVGAHAMAVSEGLWDENKFIEHCGIGTNWYTGEVGSHIDFLAASFYDYNPNDLQPRPVENVIDVMRDKAESVGLNDLVYGFDEGRIHSSSLGTHGRQLLLRIVGQTYQASYDARLLKTLVDNDIDYFSSWGYTSNAMFGGYPSVAYHVANQYHKLLSGKKLASTKMTKGHLIHKAEVDLLAGVDEDNRSVALMAYNFKPELAYKTSMKMDIDVKLPTGSGDTVSVTRYMIDDDANFFDEWEQDRKTHNITKDAFLWSPDDPAVENPTTLNAGWARDLYFDSLRDKYIEASRLIPVTKEYNVSEGRLALSLELPPHAAVFYEINY